MRPLSGASRPRVRTSVSMRRSRIGRRADGHSGYRERQRHQRPQLASARQRPGGRGSVPGPVAQSGRNAPGDRRRPQLEHRPRYRQTRIRGLSSNRVLVLDDGQRLETQQWGDEHSPNVETATAERIEVIRGRRACCTDLMQSAVSSTWCRRSYRMRAACRASSAAARAWPTAAPIVSRTARSILKGQRERRLAGKPQRAQQRQRPHPGLHAVEQRSASGRRQCDCCTHGSWGSLSASYSQRDEKLAHR